MPRTANETKHAEISADCLHAHDVILCNDGTTLRVESANKRSGRVTLLTWEGARYVVDATRLVKVQVEHGCDCSGRGTFRGGGVVENGVYKGMEGVHYACHGKGWQDRADTIRNSTYWNKYARISA
jgi:hypothetical protein